MLHMNSFKNLTMLIVWFPCTKYTNMLQDGYNYFTKLKLNVNKLLFDAQKIELLTQEEAISHFCLHP